MPWSRRRRGLPVALKVEPFAIGAVVAQWVSDARLFNVYAGPVEGFPRDEAHMVRFSTPLKMHVVPHDLVHPSAKPGSPIYVAVHPIVGGQESPHGAVASACARDAELVPEYVGLDIFRPRETVTHPCIVEPVVTDETHVWTTDLAGRADLLAASVRDGVIHVGSSAKVPPAADVDRLFEPLPDDGGAMLITPNMGVFIGKASDIVRELSERYMRPTFFNQPIGEDAEGTPVYWSDLVDENIAPADIRITL